MKRWVRRLTWVGVALCLVALALGVTERLLGPSPGVIEANVRRIRPGMTLGEVKEIMGSSNCIRWPGPYGSRTEDWQWEGERLTVSVEFDFRMRVPGDFFTVGTGFVRRVAWVPLAGQPSVWDRLRSLLGW
ncbi:MAG TPA: hypothetical protein VEL76_18315 [Gemmataceae bacterium]|nr:hypothetical protein [Gemmataceae bacterium]